MRNHFPSVAALIPSVAALAAQPASAQQNQEVKRPPNIVLILADDWGWGDLGCYGNQRIKTPHLDRMAREGTLLTQFYVSGPVCSPTRAAILTGRFPARLGLHGHLAGAEENRRRAMPDWLDPKVPTVTQMLQEAGYATGHVGKWHLGSGPGAPPPAAYGIDHAALADFWTGGNLWHPERRARSTEEIINETLRFIKANRDRPFFINAWLLDTHATLNPSREQLDVYKNLEPKNVPFTSPAQVYAAAATDADRHIGRLLDRLTELKLADNTLVIFTSDNGPEDIEIGNASHSGAGSAGPLRGRKRSLYEGGIRVPFIARWPGKVPAGRIDDTTVASTADLLPTFCALAGVPVPGAVRREIDGEDMSGLLRGRSAQRTRPLLWEWRFRIFNHPWNRSPILAVREGNWKLLLNPDRSRVELYDIIADPGEQNNVADRQPEVVGRLSEKALAWQKTLPPGPTDPAAGKDDYPWPHAGAPGGGSQ